MAKRGVISSMEQDGDTSHHMYKLMTMDTFFFLTSSISTVHFYRVDKEEAEDASDALERATRELWARVHRLLRTHAFLAGRIISHDDGMMMATSPTIGETLPDAKFREFIGEQYALRLGMSQAEMRRRVLDRALIKCARDCVDKDEPLFAVSVVADMSILPHSFETVCSRRARACFGSGPSEFPSIYIIPAGSSNMALVIANLSFSSSFFLFGFSSSPIFSSLFVIFDFN